MSLSIAERLPNGLWNFIFSKIKDPPDYLTLRQVNKKLYGISKDPISTSGLVITFNTIFKAWKYGTWSIIRSYPDMYNRALCAVISFGHLQVMKLLIAQGADIHYVDELPIKTALEYKQYDILESLFSLGVDVNYNKGHLLYLAVSKKDLPATKILLNKGANPNLDYHVLLNAVNLNQIDIVKVLLEFKANPNGNISNLNRQWSPLYQAYNQKQYEIAELLLTHGADPNDKMSYLLEHAVTNNDEIMFNQLLKYGATANANDAFLSTIKYNRLNMIFPLLSTGVILITYDVDRAIRTANNQVSKLLYLLIEKSK